jgi:hypothetical protein
MPRVENLGENVDWWYENEGGGNGSSTHDVCNNCASKLRQNPHAFDHLLEPYNGDPQGDRGWGGDVVHPEYDGEGYECAVCDRPLNDRNASVRSRRATFHGLEVGQVVTYNNRPHIVMDLIPAGKDTGFSSGEYPKVVLKPQEGGSTIETVPGLDPSLKLSVSLRDKISSLTKRVEACLNKLGYDYLTESEEFDRAVDSLKDDIETLHFERRKKEKSGFPPEMLYELDDQIEELEEELDVLLNEQDKGFWDEDYDPIDDILDDYAEQDMDQCTVCGYEDEPQYLTEKGDDLLCHQCTKDSTSSVRVQAGNEYTLSPTDLLDYDDWVLEDFDVSSKEALVSLPPVDKPVPDDLWEEYTDYAWIPVPTRPDDYYQKTDVVDFKALGKLNPEMATALRDLLAQHYSDQV